MSDIKEQKWNEVQLDVSIKEMTPRHFKWKKGEKKEKKVFYCWRVFCGRLEMDCLIVVASCLPPAIPSHSLFLSLSLSICLQARLFPIVSVMD